MIAIDIKFCFNITSIAQSTNKTHWIANVEVNMALYEKALKMRVDVVMQDFCAY